MDQGDSQGNTLPRRLILEPEHERDRVTNQGSLQPPQLIILNQNPTVAPKLVGNLQLAGGSDTTGQSEGLTGEPNVARVSKQLFQSSSPSLGSVDDTPSNSAKGPVTQHSEAAERALKSASLYKQARQPRSANKHHNYNSTPEKTASWEEVVGLPLNKQLNTAQLNALVKALFDCTPEEREYALKQVYGLSKLTKLQAIRNKWKAMLDSGEDAAFLASKGLESETDLWCKAKALSGAGLKKKVSILEDCDLPASPLPEGAPEPRDVSKLVRSVRYEHYWKAPSSQLGSDYCERVCGET